MELYIYCVVFDISKENFMFYLIMLNLNEKRLEYICDVVSFNSSITGFIMQKYILFGSYDKVKVEKFVIYLSPVAHMVQYIEDQYIDPLFLIFLLAF